MITSAKGRALIEQREGVRLKAYQDTRGIWTIGVGHTSAAGPPHVNPGMVISQAQCDQILSRDLAIFEAAVNRSVAGLPPLADHEFDACVSLSLNIGAPEFLSSTVARDLHIGKKSAAADAFLMWKNSDGKPILLGRRKAGRLQFLTPYA